MTNIYPHAQWQWESQSKLELRNFVDADLFFQHFHESVRKMSGKYEKETKRFFFLSKWSSSSRDDWSLISRHVQIWMQFTLFRIWYLTYTFLPELNFILQLWPGATMWLPPPTSSSSWPSSPCWRGSATTSSTWKPVTRWVLESSSSPPPRQSSPSPPPPPSSTAQPASSQVTVMQNELTALRPQLLETSDETEKLMIKIEQDTIQAG